MIILIPKEEEILKGDNDKVILTTHRIRKTDKDWGLLYSIEFFLEDISSIELRAQSILVFLILGGFFILLAIYVGMFDFHSLSEGSSALLFGTGIVSLLIWLATKQRIIKISCAAGRSININARKLSKEESQEFIDRVQLAKSARIDYLSGNI